MCFIDDRIGRTAGRRCRDHRHRPGNRQRSGSSIEFNDHITLFEAYASEANAVAIIAKARTLVPGKPVTELIVSHHHFDHSGGLRAAVSEGLEVITQRGNTELFAILGLPEVNVRASDCPNSAILDTTAVTRPQ